jgi:hypothetical protein
MAALVSVLAVAGLLGAAVDGCLLMCARRGGAVAEREAPALAATPGAFCCLGAAALLRV